MYYMEMRPDTDLMAQAMADAVGATKRQIQTWTDAGILLCRPETDRQGTGIRRKYPREQRAVAAFVTALSRFGLHIGEIIHYAEYLRDWLNSMEEEPDAPPDESPQRRHPWMARRVSKNTWPRRPAI